MNCLIRHLASTAQRNVKKFAAQKLQRFENWTTGRSKSKQFFFNNYIGKILGAFTDIKFLSFLPSHTAWVHITCLK